MIQVKPSACAVSKKRREVEALMAQLAEELCGRRRDLALEVPAALSRQSGKG
jgi:hypothetical protein